MTIVRSFNCKLQRVWFVVSFVRIIEQRVEWFLFSPWEELFLKIFLKECCLPYYSFYIMSSIIVILECTKSTTKPSIYVFCISTLHKEIKWPVWASRIREQSMWCTSEVLLNRYMVIIIFQQTVLFLSEKLFHYWKIQYSDWDINKEKNSLLSTLGWSWRKWQQGFAPKITRRQNLID